MRKIGISDIEDIALGAALLGAGGGGDPYIGKLLAIGAVKECGEVSLIDVDELSGRRRRCSRCKRGCSDDSHREGRGF